MEQINAAMSCQTAMSLRRSWVQTHTHANSTCPQLRQNLASCVKDLVRKARLRHVFVYFRFLNTDVEIDVYPAIHMLLIRPLNQSMFFSAPGFEGIMATVECFVLPSTTI